jgi:hypothetical protein
MSPYEEIYVHYEVKNIYLDKIVSLPMWYQRFKWIKIIVSVINLRWNLVLLDAL